jgi:hypothetical protein
LPIRKHFYKENGQTKKYTWCGSCQGGPFREEEEGTTFFKYPTHYDLCIACAKRNNVVPNELRPKSKNISSFKKTHKTI